MKKPLLLLPLASAFLFACGKTETQASSNLETSEISITGTSQGESSASSNQSLDESNQSQESLSEETSSSVSSWAEVFSENEISSFEACLNADLTSSLTFEEAIPLYVPSNVAYQSEVKGYNVAHLYFAAPTLFDATTYLKEYAAILLASSYAKADYYNYDCYENSSTGIRIVLEAEADSFDIYISNANTEYSYFFLMAADGQSPYYELQYEMKFTSSLIDGLVPLFGCHNLNGWENVGLFYGQDETSTVWGLTYGSYAEAEAQVETLQFRDGAYKVLSGEGWSLGGGASSGFNVVKTIDGVEYCLNFDWVVSENDESLFEVALIFDVL